MNRWHITFFAILILGSGWLWISRVPVDAQQMARIPQPAIGHPAPDFALTTLDGQPIALADLAGKPVVLNFWATWCGPCRRELPSLQAAADRYGDDVLIVGVDQAENPQTVQRYVDELGLSFLIPMDTDSRVGQRYNVGGLPTTYFIDPGGTIRYVWMGEMNSVTLAEGIAKVLR